MEQPTENQTQNYGGLAYAVIVLKNGDKLYYTRSEASLFAGLAEDYLQKRLSYIGVHKSLESLVNRGRETLLLMKMEDVEHIEYHGVVVFREGEGHPHFAQFQLG